MILGADFFFHFEAHSPLYLLPHKISNFSPNLRYGITVCVTFVKLHMYSLVVEWIWQQTIECDSTGSNPTWYNMNISRFFKIICTLTTVHVDGPSRTSFREGLLSAYMPSCQYQKSGGGMQSTGPCWTQQFGCQYRIPRVKRASNRDSDQSWTESRVAATLNSEMVSLDQKWLHQIENSYQLNTSRWHCDTRDHWTSGIRYPARRRLV